MGRTIIKLNDGDRDYYLEFSSIVDAPVTFGMTLEDFTAYYRDEYGRADMEYEFPRRMERVEAKGTSSLLDTSVEDQLSFNRAGKGETCLTVAQIIDAYCVNTDWSICYTPEEERTGKECPIEGKRWQDEEE